MQQALHSGHRLWQAGDPRWRRDGGERFEEARRAGSEERRRETGHDPGEATSVTRAAPIRSLMPIAVTVLAAFLLASCVSGFDEFERNRRAYNECLEDHPDDPAACEDLRIQAEKNYDDYERAAKRQWGCKQSPDRCNEPRPGVP
jgi:hypothetical protein